MKKVFLCAGHGGSDPGAVANGFKEKDLNLSIAKYCYDYLTKYNVEVEFKRNTDTTIKQEERIKACNTFKPDVAIEIHNNAGGGDGAEIFYSISGGTSKTLANNINCEIVNTGIQNSRGIKTRKGSTGKDYYGFIRETNAPAVLVECVFIDNKSDVKTVSTPVNRQKIGFAIAKGILKTLGISTQNQQKYYRVQVGAYSSKDNALNMQNKLKTLGITSYIKYE